MLNLKNCNISPEEHAKRRDYHLTSGKSLKASINKFNIVLLDSAYLAAKIPDQVPMASDPRWRNRQFGAVNTVEKSACIAFVSKVILDFYGVAVSMEDLLTEIEQKGYRQWKLTKRSKTLSMPNIDFDSLKNAFPNDEEIQNCKSLREIFEIAGDPSGIGGSMFFIDNLIKELCNDTNVETRIQTVEKILANLSVGIPVPMRVQNSIYHNDSSRAEGHYVTLFGIINGTAIVVDSSYDKNSGIRCLPVKQLFAAMLGNENLICAWDLSQISKH